RLSIERRRLLAEWLSLVRLEFPAVHDRDLLLCKFRGKRRAQRAHNHFLRQRVIVAARCGPVNGAAVAPGRWADGPDSRSPRSLLLPQLLSRAAHFALVFRLVRSGMASREIVPHGFVQQVLVHLCTEHVVGQLNLADCLAFEIFYVRNGHGRFLFTWPPWPCESGCSCRPGQQQRRARAANFHPRLFSLREDSSKSCAHSPCVPGSAVRARRAMETSLRRCHL